MRRWSSTWLIAIAVVLVAGCGADGDPASTDAPNSTESVAAALNEELAATATTIVDRLGPDDGFAAVVEALDRGYGIGQIMAGADSVEPDGSIPGVDPAGQLLDIVASAGDSTGATFILAAETLAAAPNPSAEEVQTALNRHFEPTAILTDGPTLAEVTLAEKDAAEALITGILGLVDVGYTLDQIIEGVVFGEQRWSVGRVDNDGSERRDRFACSILAADDGTLVAPEQPAPARAVESKECRRAIDSGTLHFTVDGTIVDTDSTTTSEPPEATAQDTPVATPSDHPTDGTYIGTVTVLGGGAFVVNESRAVIVVSEGTAMVAIDMSADLTIQLSEDGDPCTTRERVVMEGSGAAEPEFYVDVSSRTIDSVGLNCDVSRGADDDETFPLTGSFRGDTFVGEMLDGLFQIVASRG